MKSSNWIIISIVALVALTGILAITNVNNQGYSYGLVTAVNKNTFRLTPQQQSLPKSSLSKSYGATGYSVDSGGDSGGAECYFNSDCDSLYPNQCKKCSFGSCVDKCSSFEVCNSGVCAECSTNADCSYYDCEKCSYGKCVSKCGSTQICNDGRCEAKAECYSNSDCGSYEICYNNKCIRKGLISPECYSNGDCSSSSCEKCSNGKCVSKCSSSQVCNSGVCAECSSDFDCSSSACEKCISDKCVNKCSSTQVCNDGTCELKKLSNGRRCRINSDCLSGYCGKSVNGPEKVCQKPDCLTNSDCSYYDCEQCSNGKCVSKCDSTQVCNDGRCEVKQECYDNSDCGSYEICYNNKCVKGLISPECYSNDNCSSSACEQCNSGKCVSKCNSTQVCNAGTCELKPECYTSLDCNYYDCEKCSSGKCVNKCGTGFVCNDGKCTFKVSDWFNSIFGKLANGKRCSSDSNCASGYCGQSSSGPEKVCQEPECDSSSDCSSSACEQCNHGKCVSQCDSTQICNDGSCDLKLECNSNSDCGPYEICYNNRCVRKGLISDLTECYSNDDCSSSACEECSNGKCVNKCGTGLTCAAGKCTSVTHLDVYVRTKCNTSADCSYYDCQYCNNGYCDSKCGAKQTCDDGHCLVSDACQPNCPSDYECGNNGCGGSCGTCSLGYVCDKDHKCKKDVGRRCSTDADCASGYSCESYDGGPEKVCKENENSCSIYIDGKCINQTIPPHTNEVCNPKCNLPSVCYNGECIGTCKLGENYHEIVVFDDNGNFVESRKSDNLVTFAASGTNTCWTVNHPELHRDPNPATDISGMCIRMLAHDDCSYTLGIYDLAGRYVNGGHNNNGAFRWHTDNDYGEYLGDGTYIAQMIEKCKDGTEAITPRTVLVILRNLVQEDCTPLWADGAGGPTPTGKKRCFGWVLQVQYQYNDGTGVTYWDDDHDKNGKTKPCSDCKMDDYNCSQYDENGAETTYERVCLKDDSGLSYLKAYSCDSSGKCSLKTQYCPDNYICGKATDSNGIEYAHCVPSTSASCDNTCSDVCGDKSKNEVENDVYSVTPKVSTTPQCDCSQGTHAVKQECGKAHIENNVCHKAGTCVDGGDSDSHCSDGAASPCSDYCGSDGNLWYLIGNPDDPVEECRCDQNAPPWKGIPLTGIKENCVTPLSYTIENNVCVEKKPGVCKIENGIAQCSGEKIEHPCSDYCGDDGNVWYLIGNPDNKCTCDEKAPPWTDPSTGKEIPLTGIKETCPTEKTAVLIDNDYSCVEEEAGSCDNTTKECSGKKTYHSCGFRCNNGKTKVSYVLSSISNDANGEYCACNGGIGKLFQNCSAIQYDYHVDQADFTCKGSSEPYVCKETTVGDVPLSNGDAHCAPKSGAGISSHHCPSYCDKDDNTKIIEVAGNPDNKCICPTRDAVYNNKVPELTRIVPCGNGQVSYGYSNSGECVKKVTYGYCIHDYIDHCDQEETTPIPCDNICDALSGKVVESVVGNPAKECSCAEKDGARITPIKNCNEYCVNNNGGCTSYINGNCENGDCTGAVVGSESNNGHCSYTGPSSSCEANPPSPGPGPSPTPPPTPPSPGPPGESSVLCGHEYCQPKCDGGVKYDSYCSEDKCLYDTTPTPCPSGECEGNVCKPINCNEYCQNKHYPSGSCKIRLTCPESTLPVSFKCGGFLSWLKKCCCDRLHG